ncbi:MAG: hypothetical protein L6Q72_18755 [Burkholderiaceae bacterium]|nr:hypothetical protein [Burkholderiaceae bacterium]
MFSDPTPRLARDRQTGELLRVLRIDGAAATVTPASGASTQQRIATRVVALRDLQPVDAWAVA